MDYEKLIDLIQQIDQSSLAYLNYETDEQHIVLSKEVPNLNVPTEATPVIDHSNLIGQSAEEKIEPDSLMASADSEEETEESEEAPGKAVESPMVGVVYLQPKPDEEPYVKVGDRVEQGDVVCIVEAMKLMNEIQAPHGGIITEILVENEEVVEYKQPLIRIKE